jgi:glycosyltransferase involved in cell wall biosynthesis
MTDPLNKSGIKITLFVVALNEIEGLKIIMPQIDPAWIDQILIGDGGSTDGTQEYLKAEGYEYFVQSKPGIRHAYIEGFPKIKGDISNPGINRRNKEGLRYGHRFPLQRQCKEYRR